MSTGNLRRCLLFVPGARAERFDKALASGADQVCIDLEDAVPPHEKDSAREAAFDFIARAARTVRNGVELGVRVNPVATPLGISDLQRLIARGIEPDFVMLPKVESAGDVTAADKLLSATAIPLIALLESPRAVFESRAIAGAVERLQALMFGGFDYAVAARVKPQSTGWLWPRAQIAAAAAEAEIGAIDVPSVEFKQLDTLTRETLDVIALGFTAKAAIHPAQVAPIQQAFLPTLAERDYATRVLDAIAQGTGAAIAVDGKLVDRPIELAARRIAELAERGTRVNP
jgi:citrate lyase beta subunit